MNFQIFENKFVFKRLQNLSLKKKSKFLKKWKKNAFFPFHVYGCKIAKNVFFCVKPISWKSSKYFETSRSKKCFHTAISFGCRSTWNFQFFENFEILKFSKFSKNWKFQSLLQPKKMLVWKTFPEPKSFKILWIFAWNRFYAKKIIFGNFRVINVQ